MRQICRVLVTLSTLLLAAVPTEANPSVEILQIEPLDAQLKRDALVQAALRALTTRDMDSYLALHLSYAEAGKFMRLRKSEERILTRRKKRFARLLENMTADGVDLAKVAVVSITRRSPPRVRKGILIVGDIDIVIESNGRKFRLVLDDVLAVERGWVIGDRIKWFGTQLHPAK